MQSILKQHRAVQTQGLGKVIVLQANSFELFRRVTAKRCRQGFLKGFGYATQCRVHDHRLQASVETSLHQLRDGLPALD